MVKSETRRDAEILVRNSSPRLFGKKFRDSKKVKTKHAKTRLRDLSKTLPRFRDPAKIFRDPRFSRYHSPPLFKVKKMLTSSYLRACVNKDFVHSGSTTSFPGSLSYPSRDPGWVWSRVSQNLGDYKQTTWREGRISVRFVSRKRRRRDQWKLRIRPCLKGPVFL